MSEVDKAQQAAEPPIRESAHQTLNNMHDSLLKARDEAEHDGHLAANRVQAINEALSRIVPLIPIAMPTSSYPPVGGSSTPHSQRRW